MKSYFRQEGKNKIAKATRELRKVRDEIHNMDMNGYSGYPGYDALKSRESKLEAQITDIKNWVDFHTRKNPASSSKSVRLSNFTGTVTRNANGTVSVKGRKK